MMRPDQEAFLEEHTPKADSMVFSIKTGECLRAVYDSPVEKDQTWQRQLWGTLAAVNRAEIDEERQ